MEAQQRGDQIKASYFDAKILKIRSTILKNSTALSAPIS